MIKDMEVECKTKFSMDVEFSFSFKRDEYLHKKILTKAYGRGYDVKRI